MKIPLLASGGLFLAACCLPALELQKSGGAGDVMFGLRALVVGWSGVFAGVLGWYANPLWALAMLAAAFRKRILVAVLCAGALAVGCTVFSDVGRELPGDEGNVTKTSIVRILPGCYVWLLSMAALPVPSLFRKPA